MVITTLTFPELFSRSSKTVDVVSGQQSIDECLSLLLTSSRGELLGDPEYGTKLMEYIFNFTGEILNELIRTEIVRVVSVYEKRITVTEHDIQIIQDINTVKITLNYYINDRNRYDTFTLELERQENNYGY